MRTEAPAREVRDPRPAVIADPDRAVEPYRDAVPVVDVAALRLVVQATVRSILDDGMDDPIGDAKRVEHVLHAAESGRRRPGAVSKRPLSHVHPEVREILPGTAALGRRDHTNA